MKPWPVVASLLLVLSLHAVAAPLDEPANIGQTVDSMKSNMAERCQADDPTDLLNHELSCTCGPQALDVAYPADKRGGTASPNAVLARMGGAMNACVARTVKQVIADPCAHGVDPFAEDGKTAPGVAESRCKCANAELDKAAASSPTKDADAATARFVTGKGSQAPTPLDMLIAVQATCAGAVQK